jgi:hypothetical protein
VFDFATDKANGTHKSIFWGDQATIDTYNMAAQILSSGIQYSLVKNYVGFVEADDGYFYGSDGTTLYKIDPTTLAEIATYTLPAAPVATAIFDVSGGYCYFNSSQWSTTLNRFKISDSTNTTITLPALSSTDGGAVIGGYLYYPYEGTKIYKINLSDGTSEYKSIALLSGDNFIRRCGSDLYVIPYSSSIRTAKYDYAANTLTDTNCYLALETYYSSHSLTDKLWCKRQVNSYSGPTGVTTYQLLQQDLTKGMANMITGKLLDAPITKDATQTMKVTYTITFS